jgi:hypothetical protein
MVREVCRAGPGSCGRSIAKTQGVTELGALWASEGTELRAVELEMSGLRAGRWKVLLLNIHTFYFLTFILKREALVGLRFLFRRIVFERWKRY